MNKQLATRLREEISAIEIVDTHEHLMKRDVLSDLGINLFSALELEYLKDDLLTQGMDPNLLLERASEPDALIAELTPLLKRTRNTSYYRAFFQALRDLHELRGDELDPANLKAVSERINRAYANPDWYRYVIRDVCRIRYMLRDMDYLAADNDFIKPVIRMDSYLMLRHKNLLESWIEKGYPMYALRVPDAEYSERVRNLDDYLAFIDADFQRALDFGTVAIKIGIAYNRTLEFDKVSIDDANRAFKLPDEKTTWSDMKAFQDFIMFRIIENAGQRALPVQIHTGMFAAGKNTLWNSNPLHLTNIFLEFPHVQFDIFHGAFPFTGEIGSLALMFPNVYLDTCWLPLISYTSFKRALGEWLSYVPLGKILWGGDCGCAEGIYGAVYMIRQALSEVLAEKIEDGLFDEDLALKIAKAILHDNAQRLFRF
ncbi:MAG: amidohydrolase family protein [Candidatus Lindowbacteria bacterium]|nr:amidohydrolase family protein [Candidatus Lindowbacteria bacterium]